MRKPRADDRWDRTPTGLIVPRRPTLPTRRYINPLGSTSCECCDSGWPEECTPFVSTAPLYVDVTVSGTTNGTCPDCTDFNATWEDLEKIGCIINDPDACCQGYSNGTSGAILVEVFFLASSVNETIAMRVYLQHRFASSCFPNPPSRIYLEWGGGNQDADSSLWTSSPTPWPDTGSSTCAQYDTLGYCTSASVEVTW